MSEGIVYQNKDILFKILGQTYKEKSFAAYGIDLPPIRALLPTDLPKIAANEKRRHLRDCRLRIGIQKGE